MPASRRRAVAIDVDGALIGMDGTRRRLLRVPGLALDADTPADQDRRAALLGALAATLPHKAQVSIIVENRPADAAALTTALRAHLAPEPYTPALGEVGDRLVTWWGQRLTRPGRRHAADLAYWLLVSPYPTRDGDPSNAENARLDQAVGALTRQLVAMGLPPTVATADETRAFAGRHLAFHTRAIEDLPPLRKVDGFIAARGDEAVQSYRVVDPATGRERWVRTLYVVAPPPMTAPGWLRALVAPECPVTLVLHVRGLHRGWERRRQAWRLKIMQGAGNGTDITTGIAAEEAAAQARALHTAGNAIVRVGCYIRLEGDTRAQLDGRVSRVLQTLRDGLLAEPGYGLAHQQPLYHSTLPGYSDSARATYRWDATTVGNAWPFLAFNPGTRTLGTLLGTTDQAGDVVSLALDDPDLYNRIGVVVGRVGTGKTSLLQKIALGFLLRGDLATMVSSVDSFGALCAIAGGARAVLGGPSSATINVWDGDRAGDEERAERVRFVSAALDLLLRGLSGLEPAFLDEAVRAVYADTPDRAPVMTDLYRHMERAWTAAGVDADDKKVWRALGWKLRPYVLDGQHARLVDGPTTVALDAPLLAFDTSPLEDNATLRNYAYFAVFAIVERRRALARARSRASGRGSADHLTGLDEAWGLLTSPQAREYINRDARKARHGGNCVIFASQQVKDLIGNADAETFFTQASFKALFSIEDSGAQTAGNPKLWLQRMLNLTEEEVETAQRMSGVKGVYMPMFLTRRDRRSARDLHGVVRVELSPDEALLYASDPDDIQARQWWAERAGGDLWAGVRLAVDHRDNGDDRDDGEDEVSA